MDGNLIRTEWYYTTNMSNKMSSFFSQHDEVTSLTRSGFGGGLPSAHLTSNSPTLDLHHICWERFKCPIDGLFFSRAPGCVWGQREARRAGIGCNCPPDSDALLRSGGHVSVNMHYKIPKTNVRDWPERERVRVGGSPSRDSSLVANEEGQVIKLGRACVSLPLSNTVSNDQWAKIKWSQAKIGCLMKMDCVLTHSFQCLSVSEWMDRRPGAMLVILQATNSLNNPFRSSVRAHTRSQTRSLNCSSGISTDQQSHSQITPATGNNYTSPPS